MVNNVRRIAYYLSLAMIFTMPWKDCVRSEFGSLGKFIGVALAAVWATSVMLDGKIRRISTFHLLALLFVGWNAVSIFWSTQADETIERTKQYLQMLALTVIIWDVYRTQPQIRAGLQAFLLGTFVPIFSTIENYRVGEQAVFGRYAATGQVANLTAVVVALGIPMAFYLLQTSEQSIGSKLLRLVNLSFIPLAVFVIMLTATRFALVMAVPAFLYGLSNLAMSRRTYAVLLIPVIVFGVVVVLQRAPEASLERMASIHQEVSEGDLTGRTRIWQGAIHLWSRHPVLGLGSGAFPNGVAAIYGRPVAAHNSFLSVLAELGLVGAALFTSIVMVLAYQTWCQSPSEARFWLTMGTVWFLANCALSWEETQQTWLLLTLVAASSASFVSKVGPDIPPEDDSCELAELGGSS